MIDRNQLWNWDSLLINKDINLQPNGFSDDEETPINTKSRAVRFGERSMNGLRTCDFALNRRVSKWTSQWLVLPGAYWLLLNVLTKKAVRHFIKWTLKVETKSELECSSVLNDWIEIELFRSETSYSRTISHPNKRKRFLAMSYRATSTVTDKKKKSELVLSQ